jgi:hypothetical protein
MALKPETRLQRDAQRVFDELREAVDDTALARERLWAYASARAMAIFAERAWLAAGAPVTRMLPNEIESAHPLWAEAQRAAAAAERALARVPRQPRRPGRSAVAVPEPVRRLRSVRSA